MRIDNKQATGLRDLENLKKAIKKWREEKPNPKAPVPEKIFSRAAKLCKHFPVSKVAKILSLCHNRLKKKVLMQEKRQDENQPRTPTFVELNLKNHSIITPQSTCQILVEIRDQRRIQIALNKMQAGEWAEIIKALL